MLNQDNLHLVHLRTLITCLLNSGIKEGHHWTLHWLVWTVDLKRNTYVNIIQMCQMSKPSQRLSIIFWNDEKQFIPYNKITFPNEMDCQIETVLLEV